MESEATVITVREIIDLCKSDAADLDSISRSYLQQAGSLQFPHLLNDHLYWSYKLLQSDDISPSLVTVGLLRGSKRTGRVRLVDQTANIDCVVAPMNMGAASHQCSQACTLPSGGTHSYHCPYLHLSTLGDVVRISRFQVVAERFIVSCFPTVADTKNENYIKKMKVCCYLMFSMHDVVCLRRQENSSQTDNLCSLVKKNCTLSDSSDTSAKRIRLGSESLHINHERVSPLQNCKLSQHAVSIEEEITKSQQLVIPSDGCSFVEKIQSFSHQTKNDHVDSNEVRKKEQKLGAEQLAKTQDQTSHPVLVSDQSQIFLLMRKDALRVKHRLNSKVALSFFAAVQFLGEPQQLSVNIDTETSGLSDSLVRKHVVLDIYGNAISLYPALHVGCLYKLVKTNSAGTENFFLNLFSSCRLTKTLELNDTCQCVRIDDSLMIIPMSFVPTTSFDREMKIAATGKKTVCDSASSECHRKSAVGELVSLRGHIETRSHMRPEESKQSGEAWGKTEKDNEKLGVSMPQDRTVRVVVRDCKSTDCVVVYIRPHNTSLPLGLLTGAMVELTLVERCVSKKGVMYCQYISASSVRVVGLACDTQLHWASCGKTTLGLSVPSPQVLHLCHLVGLDTTQGGSTVFRCASCQVERVLSLSMRHTCMQCCQLCQGNQCGCGGETNTSIFSASACFSIDDGTATAVVYCYDDLVRQLLALSNSQWSTLQLHVKDQHVRYTPQWNADTGDSSDVDRYIQYLCSSTKVQRQVAMSVRKCHSSESREQSSVYRVTDYTDIHMTTVNVERQAVVTLTCPTLKLQLVAIEPVDHHDYTTQLMVSQNTAAEEK